MLAKPEIALNKFRVGRDLSLGLSNTNTNTKPLVESKVDFRRGEDTNPI